MTLAGTREVSGEVETSGELWKRCTQLSKYDPAWLREAGWGQCLPSVPELSHTGAEGCWSWRGGGMLSYLLSLGVQVQTSSQMQGSGAQEIGGRHVDVGGRGTCRTHHGFSLSLKPW